MTVFRGAYTALVTPFTADGAAVDMGRLATNISHQAEGGVAGVVPCGTTGESPTLRDDEYCAVIEKTVEAAHGHGLQVIAGAGSNNTEHAIHLHRFAHAAGADASLQVNPYYNKPSQEGLYRHFMTIADSADLPIVLYNIPGRTGVAISPETAERLDTHPNIVAIKEATGSIDSAGEILQRTALTLLSGDDAMTLPFAAIGGAGVISVVSNLLPGLVAAMCNAFLDGDWPRAMQLHNELFPLCRGLLSLDTNPVPLKAALKLLGRDSGAVRLPLVTAGDSTRDQVARLLKERNLLKEHVPAAAH